MPVTRALVHHKEGGFDDSPELESISELIQNESGCIVWLDIKDPTDEDIELLRTELRFHELALEDVLNPHERPKIDQYDGYWFLVIYAIRRGHVHEINAF